MPWAPDYITAQLLADFAGTTLEKDQADLELAVSAASRAVDRHCGRQFGQVDAPTAFYYTAEFDEEQRRWVVPIDDMMDTTGVMVAADRAGTNAYTDVIDQFVFLPRNNLAKGKPYEQLLILPSSTSQPTAAADGVRLTGKPGWTAVPKAVALASKLQGNRFFIRRDAPFGVAGSPESGTEMRLLAKVDPDLAVGLANFRRRAWSA